MDCIICHKAVNQIINGVPICEKCEKEQAQAKLRAREGTIRESSDFKSWEAADMSELFWVHLGLYQKEPNKKSLHIMKCAYLWAVHADKGLANSFHHAMEWVGIKNIQMEYKKYQEKENKK